ncbi:MAG TPA: cupin domain-containing protein [Chloroflexota bacterium]|nr:cupin domain-containing protein [Chloroflexota bacterium]
MEIQRAEGCVRVRPTEATATRQKLPYYVGISSQTTGARGLSLSLVVVPPGGRAEPHLHRDYETAIYVLEGRVRTLFGPGLKQVVDTEPGDFLFIGPNVPHQAINLSDTEPAVAVIARNDPNEQENVIPYDPSCET